MEAIYGVLYVLCAALVGLCGRHRRLRFVGFFLLSLLITPPLGLLVVYLTEVRSSRERSPRRC